MQPPPPVAGVTRPAHLTYEQQQQVIDRGLRFVLDKSETFEFKVSFDQITLYDPPYFEDGFPKLLKIPLEFFQYFENVHSFFTHYLDLTFCQIDLPTLQFFVRLDTIRKIITTIDIRPALQGEQVPTSHVFRCRTTELQVVRNVFRNVVPQGAVFAGVRFDPDETPHKYPKEMHRYHYEVGARWTDLLPGRSDPSTRVYPSLKAAAKVQVVATKTEAPKASLSSKVNGFLKTLNEKPVAVKTPESFREVPFNRQLAIKALGQIINQGEAFVEQNIQNLELFICLTGTEKGFPMSLRITRDAMLKSLLPFAISSQTRELNFENCLLDEHVLVDLLENLADLYVDFVVITRKLTRYEGMALLAQKKLIERRHPTKPLDFYLFSYQPDSKSEVRELEVPKDIAP